MKLPEVELIRLDVNDPDQVGFMYKVRTNKKVDSYLTGSPPKDLGTHIKYLIGVKKEKAFFLVTDLKSKEYVGYCQFTMDYEQEVEVGWVVHPDHWGKGYGKISVKKTIELMKSWFPKGTKFILYVLKKNEKAIHIYKSFGFEETWSAEILIDGIKMGMVNE